VVRKAKPKWLKRRLPTGPGYEKQDERSVAVAFIPFARRHAVPISLSVLEKEQQPLCLWGKTALEIADFVPSATRKRSPSTPLNLNQIASAVQDMELSYAVLTSVTRDDLEDGGAAHFAQTINAIRHHCPETLVEVLIPDLQGNKDDLAVICDHGPSVLNHNVETVAGLYSEVRPQAVYGRSLELLKKSKEVLSSYNYQVRHYARTWGNQKRSFKRPCLIFGRTGCDLLTLGQ